jgi:hypothetical protein
MLSPTTFQGEWTMSHTTKYKLQITDAECAQKALMRMGFKAAQIESHDEATQLFDYAGRTMPRLKANVVIRRNHLNGAVNDFGIRIGEDGSEVFVDGMQIDTKRLEQCYGVEKALKDADAMGYFATEEIMEDGRIRLRVTR